MALEEAEEVEVSVMNGMLLAGCCEIVMVMHMVACDDAYGCVSVQVVAAVVLEAALAEVVAEEVTVVAAAAAAAVVMSAQETGHVLMSKYSWLILSRIITVKNETI